jgi:hypothetical protein
VIVEAIPSGEVEMGEIIGEMTGAQLLGAIIGGIVGLAVGGGIAGPSWQHIGGGWVVQTDEGMGCIPGCLV